MNRDSGPQSPASPPGEDRPATELAPERDDGGSSDAPAGVVSDATQDERFEAASTVPTRASAMWTAAVAATVLLLLVTIFVGQNTQRAGINFLWWHGHAPAAVLLLLAAVAGAALVTGAAITRILQLRRRHSAVGSSVEPRVRVSGTRHR